MRGHGLLLRSIRNVTQRTPVGRSTILRCSRTIQGPTDVFSPGTRRGYADHIDNVLLRESVLPVKPHEHRPGAQDEDYPRPTATYLISDVSKLDTEDLISQLPRVVPSLKNKHLKTVVFLATPGLAHLFEPDHDFLALALKHVLKQVKQRASCTSIVGIIDAVPFYTIKGAQPLPAKPSEGISLLISSSVKTQPGDLSDDKAAVFEISSTSVDATGVRLPVVSLKAPVANTLFVNGRRNTLFAQGWEWNVASQKWESSDKSPRQNLSQVNIRAYSSYDATILEPEGLEVFAYLKPLTGSGIVVSSMGNVVREIQLHEHGTKPASYELELLVPSLLKHARELDQNTEIEIFALVYPPRLRDEDSRDGCYGMVKLDESWFLKLLVQGARLHRVTSGGGGWGNKAGLLAFEPATDFDHNIDEISSMFPGFAIEGDNLEMPATRDIIPKGHVVQFFRLFIHTPKRHAKEAIFEPNPSQPPFGMWYQPEVTHKYSIGTMLNRPDGRMGVKHGGIESEEVTLAATDEVQQDNIGVVPNRFGFLTAASVCLTVQGDRPNANRAATGGTHTHSTLIEAQSTCFTFNFPNGGRNSKRENRAINANPKTSRLYNKIAAELRRELQYLDASSSKQKHTSEASDTFFAPLGETVPIHRYAKAPGKKVRFVLSEPMIEAVVRQVTSDDSLRAEKLRVLMNKRVRTSQERRIIESLVLNLYDEVLRQEETELDEDTKKAMDAGIHRTAELLAEL